MVTLALMMRDEAGNLPRLAASVRDRIDGYVALDTGSSDGSPTILRDLFSGLPGTVHERPWQGFANSRTELLELARGDGHLLLMDADETLDPSPLPDLDALDMVELRYAGPLDYAQPRLIRASLPWRFEGAAHACLTGPPTAARLTVDAPRVVHHGSGRHGTAKAERDLQLLEAALADDPLDARAVFYLAQTLRELGRVDEAIDAYRRRIMLGGWDEEVFYSRYRLGCLLCQHRSFAEGALELYAAWRFRPTRIEPLRALAYAANAVADKAPYPDDRLFVHRDQYRR